MSCSIPCSFCLPAMNPLAYLTRAKTSDLAFNGFYAAVAGAGALLVASGHMEAGTLGIFSFLVPVLLAVLSGIGYIKPPQRLVDQHGPLPVLRDTGLLVLAWMLYRLLFPLLWQAALLPFLALGFLLSRQKASVLPVPLVAAFIMESGLLASGGQSFATFFAMLVSLALFLLVFTGHFRFFPRLASPARERYRRRNRRRPNRRNHFSKTSTPRLNPLPKRCRTEGAIALFSEALHGLLTMASERLGAITVALLWPLSDGSYKARETVTDRTDLLAGPFPSDSGLLAALSQTDRITVNAPRLDGPRLPFYQNNEGIGAFFIQRLDLPFHEVESAGKKSIHALLTIDRPGEIPFEEADKAFIDQAVRQLKTLFTIEKNMRLVALGPGQDPDRLRRTAPA